MPPIRRTFSKSQIATVQRMTAEGCSRTEIAQAIGLRNYNQLNWHTRQGDFGKLPDRRGQRKQGMQRTDNEATGQLFGQRRQDWERRLKGIQESWSADEEKRRQVGEMPNGERAYGLRDNKGHRNQWTK